MSQAPVCLSIGLLLSSLQRRVLASLYLILSQCLDGVYCRQRAGLNMSIAKAYPAQNYRSLHKDSDGSDINKSLLNWFYIHLEKESENKTGVIRSDKMWHLLLIFVFKYWWVCATDALELCLSCTNPSICHAPGCTCTHTHTHKHNC